MDRLIAPAESGSPGESDLRVLQSALSQTMSALLAWNIPVFERSVSRQRELIAQLNANPEWRNAPGTVEIAQQIRDLNRSYARLLKHSTYWTRTINAIIQAGGMPFSSRASIHLRG